MPAVRHVNGFYPCPVPVSLTEEAAVFASGGALYRVDARMNARRQDLAGEITQVVQTEQGIRALAWARDGRAELVRLDERLQVLGRRQLLPGGAAPRRGMEDPYDPEDWRNQREFFLLTEEDAVRLSFQISPEDGLAEALILDRTPLEGGETLRRVIGGPELEAALGGGHRLLHLDARAGGDTQLWAYRDQVFLNVRLWDENRPGSREILLQIGGDGTVSVLWDPPEDSNGLDGRACFFDFDRGLMWTLPRPKEAGYPSERLPRCRLHARRIAPGAPAVNGLPAWEDADLYTGYFDGQLTFDGREGFRALALDGTRSGDWTRAARNVYPIVLWQGRLLLDLEGTGRPRAYPAQFDPAAGRELVWE